MVGVVTPAGAWSHRHASEFELPHDSAVDMVIPCAGQEVCFGVSLPRQVCLWRVSYRRPVRMRHTTGSGAAVRLRRCRARRHMQVWRRHGTCKAACER